MSTISIDRVDELPQTRHEVECFCQTLVDAGAAQWWVNEEGNTELHLASGEAYLFGELDVTRLK